MRALLHVSVLLTLLVAACSSQHKQSSAPVGSKQSNTEADAIVVLSVVSLRGAEYEILKPRPREVQLAQLAGDWLCHDDWHTPVPTNAYAGSWRRRIPEFRADLLSRYVSISVNVRAGPKSFALFTYNIKERLLVQRPAEPNLWPTPRLIVEAPTGPGPKAQLVVRCSDSDVQFQLGCCYTTNGPVIVSIDRMWFVD